MQFRDLGKQYQVLKKEIDEAIENVINTSNFIMGKPVEEIEEQLAEYIGVKHCITCANGTDALQLSLMALEIGPGDAVFVPNFTFFSTGEVVSAVGATPIFVDIKAETFNIDAEDLIRKIVYVKKHTNLRLKVIISVDLFGQPAEYALITQIAKEHSLLLIEDGAQGFGGSINGKKACSFGDISTTSFFPAKPLGCYGDGGAIFTDNSEWAYLLKSYRVHGKGQNKYDNIRIGMNSRLDTIQAAILKVKFEAFRKNELDEVNKIARQYDRMLKNHVSIPVILEGYQSSWAQYTILLPIEKRRTDIQKYLMEKGIPTMVYYPIGLHRQKAFQGNICSELNYYMTDYVSEKCLSLPMHPYLTDDNIEEISNCLIEALEKCKDEEEISFSSR